MTQDQQGRLRMGAREWIAFASLLVGLVVHGISFIVMMAKLDARVATAETLLRRIDDRRESDGSLVQRVTDMDRRIQSLEDFLRSNMMQRVKP